MLQWFKTLYILLTAESKMEDREQKNKNNNNSKNNWKKN